MLYLENNLTIGAFTPARMAVLKLLASEAAISMENARLYRDLAEREARIRRLVDANIIGIFFWDLEGQILEANNAFLLMVGYDREDLASGRVRWTDLTPPEWRDREEQNVRARTEGDRSSAALREGVLPKGRQPRPCTDRRGNIRRGRATRASHSCST